MASLASAVGNRHLGMEHLVISAEQMDKARADGWARQETGGFGVGISDFLGALVGLGRGSPERRCAQGHGCPEIRGRNSGRWGGMEAPSPAAAHLGGSGPGHGPRSVACHELVGGAHTKMMPE